MNLTPTCVECGRVFDLTNETDIQEWEFGHDCEPDDDEPTDAQVLRDLVDTEGVIVHWSNEGYAVEHWNYGSGHDSYEIVCRHNRHAIGLTWADGVTLNGQRLDFFADIAGDSPILEQHPSGTRYCRACGCTVILFDDDTHTCTIWRNP